MRNALHYHMLTVNYVVAQFQNTVLYLRWCSAAQCCSGALAQWSVGAVERSGAVQCSRSVLRSGVVLCSAAQWCSAA